MSDKLNIKIRQNMSILAKIQFATVKTHLAFLAINFASDLNAQAYWNTNDMEVTFLCPQSANYKCVD